MMAGQNIKGCWFATLMVISLCVWTLEGSVVHRKLQGRSSHTQLQPIETNNQPVSTRTDAADTDVWMVMAPGTVEPVIVPHSKQYSKHAVGKDGPQTGSTSDVHQQQSGSIGSTTHTEDTRYWTVFGDMFEPAVERHQPHDAVSGIDVLNDKGSAQRVPAEQLNDDHTWVVVDGIVEPGVSHLANYLITGIEYVDRRYLQPAAEAVHSFLQSLTGNLWWHVHDAKNAVHALLCHLFKSPLPQNVDPSYVVVTLGDSQLIITSNQPARHKQQQSNQHARPLGKQSNRHFVMMSMGGPDVIPADAVSPAAPGATSNSVHSPIPATLAPLNSASAPGAANKAVRAVRIPDPLLALLGQQQQQVTQHADTPDDQELTDLIDELPHHSHHPQMLQQEYIDQLRPDFYTGPVHPWQPDHTDTMVSSINDAMFDLKDPAPRGINLGTRDDGTSGPDLQGLPETVNDASMLQHVLDDQLKSLAAASDPDSAGAAQLLAAGQPFIPNAEELANDAATVVNRLQTATSTSELPTGMDALGSGSYGDEYADLHDASGMLADYMDGLDDAYDQLYLQGTDVELHDNGNFVTVIDVEKTNEPVEKADVSPELDSSAYEGLSSSYANSMEHVFGLDMYDSIYEDTDHHTAYGYDDDWYDMGAALDANSVYGYADYDHEAADTNDRSDFSTPALDVAVPGIQVNAPEYATEQHQYDVREMSPATGHADYADVTDVEQAYLQDLQDYAYWVNAATSTIGSHYDHGHLYHETDQQLLQKHPEGEPAAAVHNKPHTGDDPTLLKVKGVPDAWQDGSIANV